MSGTTMSYNLHVENRRIVNMQVLRPAGKLQYLSLVRYTEVNSTPFIIGNNERRCITRDVLGLYGSIITVGTYRSQDLQQDLTKDPIFRALKKCLEVHTTLSTIVQDSKTEKPQLARAAKIDLEKHVCILRPDEKNENAIQSLLERAHNEPLSDYEARPQWRLYIALDGPSKSFHVAFASSHALADGMSGFLFHKTFLEALREPPHLAFDADPVFEPSTQRTLPPALEQAGNLTITWSFLIGPLLGEFCPVWLARMLGVSKENPDSNPPWCGPAIRPARTSTNSLVKTAVHVTAVPPELLQSALAACRKHDARLTGLLNHLMCRALARSLRSRGKQYERFVTETAIDLRRCLPADIQESMGNFVSAVTETVEISPSSLDSGANLADSDWESIRSTTQRLGEKSNTLADQPTGLLKYLSNYREWSMKKAATPAEASFGMSNLGTFDGSSTNDSASSWVVDEMVFSQSADATGGPFNLNVASGKGGLLMLVVTWMPGMFELEEERLFVQDTMKDVVSQLKAFPA